MSSSEVFGDFFGGGDVFLSSAISVVSIIKIVGVAVSPETDVDGSVGGELGNE